MVTQTEPSQCLETVQKVKQVAVLSHWDDGLIGVYETVNDAKRQVLYRKCSTYVGFYKNKWGGWSYKNGGFEIHKMSETEAEILFRYNEVRE